METAQKLLHPGEKPSMAGLCSLIDKKREQRRQVNHHLYVVLTEFSYQSDDLELYFSLYSTKESNYVSEKVLVSTFALMIEEQRKNGALFTDAGNLDQIRDLHLVCHAIKNSKMGINNNNENSSFNTLTSTKKSTCFRRPYACAVMSISKIITKGVGTVMEFEAKLQMTDDKEFYHLHDQILKKNSAKFSPVPGASANSCLKVSLRLVNAVTDYSFENVTSIPLVRRLGNFQLKSLTVLCI